MHSAFGFLLSVLCFQLLALCFLTKQSLPHFVITLQQLLIVTKNTPMTFEAYRSYFEEIIQKTADEQVAPYNNPDYFDYTKLNWSRMNRWLKTGILTDEIKQTMQEITSPQNWIVITEPWCGDAAHSVPFLEMISRLNPLITVSYELRDSEPFTINNYLTNGGKSIPKLIIRNTEGKDLATWGPRPADCQLVYDKLTADKADFETVKTELQVWYNADKGKSVQEELVALLKNIDKNALINN